MPPGVPLGEEAADGEPGPLSWGTGGAVPETGGLEGSVGGCG